MEIFWHSWIAVAIAVPVFYALDSVLDVFFVGKNVFQNPAHATVISGLFSIIYLVGLIYNHEIFNFPDITLTLVCLANGMLYIAHVYFYFKVLFKLNDASNLECFLGFSVILVPVLAFVFLGEKLAMFQYLGILISFLGVTCLFVISVTKRSFKDSFYNMTNTVVLLSLTYIIQDKVYQQVNFHTGLTLFLIGQALASILLWKFKKCRLSIRETCKFGPLFFISQMLGVAAVIFSQRAINISPSVTFVVAIETTTPLFIMMFSLMAISFLKLFSGQQCICIPIFKLQLNKMAYKCLAFSCLLFGVIMTSSPDLIKSYVDTNLVAITSSTTTPR